MKSWKDVPHLFGNGKFKVKEYKFMPDRIYNITGYDNSFTNGCFIYDGCRINIKYCTLIARKIEDMTDEEWGEMKLAKFNKNQIERRKKWFKIQVLTANDLLYLLSIGVYPFDQSAFKNGTVIDINTL